MSDDKLTLEITKQDIERILSKRAVETVEAMRFEPWINRHIENAIREQMRDRLQDEATAFVTVSIDAVIKDEKLLKKLVADEASVQIRDAVKEYVKSQGAKAIIKNAVADLINKMGGKNDR